VRLTWICIPCGSSCFFTHSCKLRCSLSVSQALSLLSISFRCVFILPQPLKIWTYLITLLRVQFGAAIGCENDKIVRKAALRIDRCHVSEGGLPRFLASQGNDPPPPATSGFCNPLLTHPSRIISSYSTPRGTHHASIWIRCLSRVSGLLCKKKSKAEKLSYQILWFFLLLYSLSRFCFSRPYKIRTAQTFALHNINKLGNTYSFVYLH
jgi:hypothetical protein